MKLYALALVLFLVSSQVADDCYSTAVDPHSSLNKNSTDLSASADPGVATAGLSPEDRLDVQRSFYLRAQALSAENLAQGDDLSFIDIDEAILIAPGVADSWTDKAAMQVATGRTTDTEKTLGTARGIFKDAYPPDPNQKRVEYSAEYSDYRYTNAYLKSLRIVYGRLPAGADKQRERLREEICKQYRLAPNIKENNKPLPLIGVPGVRC